jgi:hypothetical protein
LGSRPRSAADNRMERKTWVWVAGRERPLTTLSKSILGSLTEHLGTSLRPTGANDKREACLEFTQAARAADNRAMHDPAKRGTGGGTLPQACVTPGGCVPKPLARTAPAPRRPASAGAARRGSRPPLRRRRRGRRCLRGAFAHHAAAQVANLDAGDVLAPLAGAHDWLQRRLRQLGHAEEHCGDPSRDLGRSGAAALRGCVNDAVQCSRDAAVGTNLREPAKDAECAVCRGRCWHRLQLSAHLHLQPRQPFGRTARICRLFWTSHGELQRHKTAIVHA